MSGPKGDVSGQLGGRLVDGLDVFNAVGPGGFTPRLPLRDI